MDKRTIFLDGLLTGSYDLKISTPSGVTFVQDVFYLNPQPTITDFFPNQIVYGSNSSFTIDISGANTMWTGNDFIDSTLSIALVDTDTIYYATSFSVVDEDSIAYATFPTTLPLNDYQLKIINPEYELTASAPLQIVSSIDGCTDPSACNYNPLATYNEEGGVTIQNNFTIVRGLVI